MSAFTEDLPNNVVQDWRRFSAQSSFAKGIDWLRHNTAPKITGTTPVEKFENAVAWNAYQKALNDIEDRLTKLKIADPGLDEPPLRTP